jgi:glycosyltransferase involved in cell wall biosynthesis
LDALAYAPRDGGFATAIHDVLRSAAATDDVEVVTAVHRAHARGLERFGTRVIGVRFPPRARFFAGQYLIPRLARRVRADVVHSEISALPRHLGRPASVTVNDLYLLMDPATGGQSLSQRAMTRYWSGPFIRSLHRATAVKAISQTTADDVARLVSRDIDVQVIRPRIEPVAHAPRPPAPTGGEPIRILAVGSVVPRRNLPFLLQAMQRVERPWTLDVVGSNWWGSGDLQSHARDRRIAWHGYVSDDRLGQLRAECHLFVSASRYEGFGYPVGEALAQGMAVLGSDIPTYREFLPAAWRFPLDDPSQLARRIDDLDAETYVKMTEQAVGLTAMFAPEHHAAAQRRLFLHLAEAA